MFENFHYLFSSFDVYFFVTADSEDHEERPSDSGSSRSRSPSEHRSSAYREEDSHSSSGSEQQSFHSRTSRTSAASIPSNPSHHSATPNEMQLEMELHSHASLHSHFSHQSSHSHLSQSSTQASTPRAQHEVAPFDSGRSEAMKQHFHRVASEFVDTERVYVELLTALVDVCLAVFINRISLLFPRFSKSNYLANHKVSH